MLKHSLVHRTFYNIHRYKETPVGNSQIKTDENPHLKQIFKHFLPDDGAEQFVSVVDLALPFLSKDAKHTESEDSPEELWL